MEEHDCVVCRCEAVGLADLLTAIHEDGATTAQEVKMLTRAGQGICGGRTCNYVVARVVSSETGIAPKDLVWPRSRPPVRPTVLHEVADPSEDAIFTHSKSHIDLLSAADKPQNGQ